MNFRCWLFGHKNDGKRVPKSSNNNTEGEWRDCWQYYCVRCDDPENFPLNQYPDPRNLYRRTIGLQIIRIRNWIAFIPHRCPIRRAESHKAWLAGLKEQNF